AVLGGAGADPGAAASSGDGGERPAVTGESAYGVPCVDVPAERWVEALRLARDELGCTYFDWLCAVDEIDGFHVVTHLFAIESGYSLLVRTWLPPQAPALATATGVFAGASWHERETHEMFGIDFVGHPRLDPLLLPEGFEGHPLRKSFVLASRAAKPWPGGKEPGESGEGSPSRRKTQPPGVPDPSWGPRPPSGSSGG
ncbi:MAG: NADH-quinone oxidoreductase subunit C, partial [Actinomycetota bacterium]|nr:NADH-quinone oxidoreductase subunit C [Actinomycetota bacterium]